MRLPDERFSELKSNAEQLSGVILQLERSLRRSYHASRITPARLSALHTISGIRGCTIGQLAQAEQVTAPTVTGIVEALVKTKLITREPDHKDRRISRLELTELGTAALDNWYEWRAGQITRKLNSADLTETELALVIDALAKLT
ncbi:MAG: MarR family transcriptional regulator [Chloroflexi bacterium]|nr:MarR family transcriptional regulator [Chloroflexota bacterium]